MDSGDSCAREPRGGERMGEAGRVGEPPRGHSAIAAPRRPAGAEADTLQTPPPTTTTSPGLPFPSPGLTVTPGPRNPGIPPADVAPLRQLADNRRHPSFSNSTATGPAQLSEQGARGLHSPGAALSRKGSVPAPASWLSAQPGPASGGMCGPRTAQCSPF